MLINSLSSSLLAIPVEIAAQLAANQSRTPEASSAPGSDKESQNTGTTQPDNHDPKLPQGQRNRPYRVVSQIASVIEKNRNNMDPSEVLVAGNEVHSFKRLAKSLSDQGQASKPTKDDPFAQYEPAVGAEASSSDIISRHDNSPRLDDTANRVADSTSFSQTGSAGSRMVESVINEQLTDAASTFRHNGGFSLFQRDTQQVELIDSNEYPRVADSFVQPVTTSSVVANTTVAAANFVSSPVGLTSTMIPSMISSSMSSQLFNNGTTTSGLATVNYNGLIGINATDPFALTTESRSFGLPLEIQILMCLLYGILAFTAITSNMIVCYIVLSSQRMRTATNYFIVNLAVGDILMALLCIPFTIAANLIFQFWPFGLSLCVIVSYSQANSVFISAYTMVAISIDKYLAIMYPMRLRMPKVQAKIIILVIWSLALITSLPTALLSSLEPAPADSSPPAPLTSPTITTTITTQLPFSVATNNSPLAQSFQTSRSSMSNETVSTTTELPYAEDSNIDQTEHKKYFCQESWTFWERGKYYYSMALMVLQFVLPLFVLVITYTRIVIVVWGKRMPGEEDNARDARMARSKRKMIKMVIFCVIAFALTWLPFNALIVIGDLHPVIWEHQNIMYIWFITHYLAMCHTITNPLIYIWMNNRFRAGFKQVIGNLCRATHHALAFLCCYCLCLGCLLDCSRRKYADMLREMNQKRPRSTLASSGSINFTNHQHVNTGGNGNQGGAGADNSGAGLGGPHTSRRAGGPKRGQDGATTGQCVTGQMTSSGYPWTHISGNAAGSSTTNNTRVRYKMGGDLGCGAIDSVASTSSLQGRDSFHLLAGSPTEQTANGFLKLMGEAAGGNRLSDSYELSQCDGGLTQTSSQARADFPTCTSKLLLSGRAGGLHVDEDHQADVTFHQATQSANIASALCRLGGLKPLRLFRRHRSPNHNDTSKKRSTNSTATDDRGERETECGQSNLATQSANATNRRKKRCQSHVIGLQLTTTELYTRPPKTAVATCDDKRPHQESQDAGTSEKLIYHNHPDHKYCRSDPFGVSQAAINFAPLPTRSSANIAKVCRGQVWALRTGGRRRLWKRSRANTSNFLPPAERQQQQGELGDKFVAEMRQSTVTISAQTNNTSLAISLMHSLQTNIDSERRGLNVSNGGVPRAIRYSTSLRSQSGCHRGPHIDHESAAPREAAKANPRHRSATSASSPTGEQSRLAMILPNRGRLQSDGAQEDDRGSAGWTGARSLDKLSHARVVVAREAGGHTWNSGVGRPGKSSSKVPATVETAFSTSTSNLERPPRESDGSSDPAGRFHEWQHTNQRKESDGAIRPKTLQSEPVGHPTGMEGPSNQRRDHDEWLAAESEPVAGHKGAPIDKLFEMHPFGRLFRSTGGKLSTDDSPLVRGIESQAVELHRPVAGVS